MSFALVIAVILVLHEVCAIEALSLPRGTDYSQVEWLLYKKRFNKTYETKKEEVNARDQFLLNIFYHYLHNLNDNYNFTQGVHEHSDKSPGEAIDILCGTDVPLEARNVSRRSFVSSRQLNQDHVNWVEKGKVSAVLKQGTCGSCWAFTAAQALESQLAICHNTIHQMSKQQLVDCSYDYGNEGCKGGWPNNAFYYMMYEGGSVTEDCYPYRETEGECDINESCKLFAVEDVVDVGPSGDEDAVANALADKGPLAIAIHVDEKMVAYSGGIYHSDSCNGEVNHGVLLVGYGTDNGQPYWLIKNSWGASWGENGYVRIARNQGNMCHVATYPSYPVIKC